MRILIAIACLAALYALYHGAAVAIDTYGARQGASLYQANCASCHGADLAGRPGWQSPQDVKNWPAPPLGTAGHAWMHDDAALFMHVKNGSAISPMPAFAETLTDNEIWQIFAHVKTQWPKGVRAYQHAGDPYAPLPGDLPADWLYPPACEPGAGPGVLAARSTQLAPPHPPPEGRGLSHRVGSHHRALNPLSPLAGGGPGWGAR